MSLPDLDESAWELAKANTAGVYGSGAFGIATTVVSVLTGAIAAWASSGGEPEEGIVVGVIAGLGGLLVCLLTVLLFEIGAAPLRQRNELRQAFESQDQLDDSQVLISLIDFLRRGEDHLSECRVRDFTTGDEAKLEDWTREVVDFLGRHCEERPARDFALASRGSSTFLARLEKRLAALGAIVASASSAGLRSHSGALSSSASTAS